MIERSALLLVVLAACTPAEPPVAPTEPGSSSLPIASPPPDAPLGSPLAAGQVWSGVYLCPQGQTALRLHINGTSGTAVEAIFEFSHAASGANGQFHLAGNFDSETRRLALEPGDWISRPPGYESAGLDGTLSRDGMTYEGRITNPECGKFRVSLGTR